MFIMAELTERVNGTDKKPYVKISVCENTKGISGKNSMLMQMHLTKNWTELNPDADTLEEMGVSHPRTVSTADTREAREKLQARMHEIELEAGHMVCDYVKANQTTGQHLGSVDETSPRNLFFDKCVIDRLCTGSDVYVYLNDCEIDVVDGDTIIAECTGTRIKNLRGNASIRYVKNSCSIVNMSEKSNIYLMDGESDITYMSDDATITTLSGYTIIGTMSGKAYVDTMNEHACIKEMNGTSTVRDINDHARIGHVRGLADVARAHGNTEINEISQEASVIKMEKDACVKKASGNAVINTMYNRARVERLTQNACVKCMTDRSTVVKATDNAMIRSMEFSSMVITLEGHARIADIKGSATVNTMLENSKVGPSMTEVMDIIQNCMSHVQNDKRNNKEETQNT